MKYRSLWDWDMKVTNNYIGVLQKVYLLIDELNSAWWVLEVDSFKRADEISFALGLIYEIDK